MNLSLFFASVCSLSTQTQPVVIGTHYTDALAGLVVYRGAKESVLLSIEWVTKDGKVHKGYNELSDAKLRFGEAAPNDSYHRISWKVDASTITYEWGLTGSGSAVGKVSSTGDIEIRLRLGQAWPGPKSEFVSNSSRIIEKSGSLEVSLDVDGRVLPSGIQTSGWSGRYLISKKAPLDFSIGVGPRPDPRLAETLLVSAKKRYLKTRLWSEGDWGGFVDPLQNQMGNSKVFSIETGRLAQIVSRRWCLPDGQVLFCWDSFFNGLLTCLEDPAGAKQTVRAALNGVTKEGFVPNFSGRGWGTSVDRSQPCVGAMCVWKINQRAPDLAFLKEVYPKLLKWHKWWYTKRDGNHDGILEWGSATGDLQNAKFESGLDDSPMFDDGKMVGPNMNLDSTDLTGLYAMDADYLAKIAQAIGRSAEAKTLQNERVRIVKRMNEKLWNNALNAYCYRYWTPKQPIETLKQESVFSFDGKPGFRGEYYHGRALAGDPVVRQEPKVDFGWTNGPTAGFGQNDFSARYSADFTAPTSDAYIFHVVADDGVRIFLDDQMIVDSWKVQAPTAFDSKSIQLEAGSHHHFQLEYFQGDGGAEVHLTVRKTLVNVPGQIFYNRLSPLNFYPLIAKAASKERGRKTLDVFFKPTKFGGDQVCPTISRDDPAFPAQGYWRGTVWGPTTYLTFLGVRKYATDAESIDYAEKSVRLFMENWLVDGTCRENFNIKTFKSSSDPHYTWGALMCLLGLEQLCDVEADGRIRLNGNSGRRIAVHNLRLKGRIFDLHIEPHKATLREHGNIVAIARGKVTKVKI